MEAMTRREIATEAQDEMWQVVSTAEPGGPTPRQVELIARRLCDIIDERWPMSCSEASRLIAKLGPIES